MGDGRWPIPHSRCSWHLSISLGKQNAQEGDVIWDVFAPPQNDSGDDDYMEGQLLLELLDTEYWN